MTRLVVECTQCWRFEIIELPVPRGPAKRDRCTARQKESDREDQEQDGHVRPSSKVLLRSASVTTVMELSGIKIAATNGLRCPLIAKAMPTRL